MRKNKGAECPNNSDTATTESGGMADLTYSIGRRVGATLSLSALVMISGLWMLCISLQIFCQPYFSQKADYKYDD